MVLEATVVCVDNSDWMINGDYKPTRLQAQAEAVNLLAGAKTGSNPENTVGVLSLAGMRGPKVLATPTPDLGRVLNCMHDLKAEGSVSLIQGVQIAQLALKHRQNKNQRQRIVAFIGSPLEDEERALVKVAKKLKKNNVSVDVVCFGDEGVVANGAKLEAFVNAVNSNDNSHLVTVPPGSGALSDILLSTPVFTGDQEGSEGPSSGAMAGGSSGGGGGGDFEFGVDPNLDPELALALRVSMEEERARQQAAAAKEQKEQNPGEGQAAGDANPPAEKEAAAGGEASTVGMDAEVTPAPAGGEANNNNSGAGDKVDDDGDVQMDDDAILQQALAMSLAGADPSAEGEAGADDGKASASGSAGGLDAMLEDKSFITSVLSNLQGVDVSDENVQQVLSALKQQQSPGSKQDEKEDKDKPEDESS